MLKARQFGHEKKMMYLGKLLIVSYISFGKTPWNFDQKFAMTNYA